ncbi:MAG: hypothetical protein IJ759_07070 [Bacteroidales bacterium]|nr:hypothetical protein [Bacteroidales bacterium]
MIVNLVIVTGIVGFILGFTNWALECPPRLFWKLSDVELFQNRFMMALGYGILFALIPLEICLFMDYFA